MKPFGLVTCNQFPELSPDDRPLISEFAAIGREAAPVVWDDPGVDWSRFDLLILRSCWDYHLQIEEFRKWIDASEALGVALLNPPDLIRWNLHKSYLADLQKRGVSIPRTGWVEQGSTVDLRDFIWERGWKQAVVKPAVSAGAWKTHHVSESTMEEGQRSLDDLVRERDVLIQEFLPEVVESGELSLIFIGGAYSHAVRKLPGTGNFRVGEENGGSDVAAAPGAEVIERAGAILDRMSAPSLYARVDGIERKGEFLLTELELIEPFLFFRHHPAARRRFASAVSELQSSKVPKS
jgi:hypothetical protein